MALLLFSYVKDWFMRAAQTYQNKLTKLGFPQPPHYPIGVGRVHVDGPNVEGVVFQNSKTISNVLVLRRAPEILPGSLSTGPF